MKILLVEDSATIRYAMCKYIEDAGHTTIVAESGEAALQILDTTPVDMVIMDVEMPGLDGFETTRLIREWMGDHWIPIIFVTGKSEAESLEEGISAGGDDYLIKPVNQTILNAKIRAMERITEMRNQLHKLNQELIELSQRDGLSGLYNRRAFEEKAAELWDHATRNKSPLTVVLLDIDHFKNYNDSYGHPAGDECIRQVADVLQRCLSRSTDLVGRYGGEEFIALLANTNLSGAEHMCEMIREAVEGLGIKHRDSSCSNVVTVSIGASALKYTTGTDLKFQINKADQALYESKSSGRNYATVREYSAEAKVLIIEADDDRLEEMRQSLNGHCRVITSTHDYECVALAEEYFPDIIILDAQNQPDVGKTCDKLKDNPKTKSIPLVLMAEGGEAICQANGQCTSAEVCLPTPVSADRLLATIRQFVP